MITFFQSIILGVMQGITELFPVSSLGHTVLVPTLLGWNIDQANSYFLNFLVATHLATATVLLIFFWQDWTLITKGFIASIKKRSIKDNYYGRLAWLLIIGTVPAGLIGLLLQKKIQAGFANPQLAAFILIINGLMLFLGEVLRKRAIKKQESHDKTLSKLSFMQSFKVGIAQIVALIPGFSRSGSTLTGGLMVGLTHEDALRFSFLLATPIIGAAALLKMPSLLLHSDATTLILILVGALCSAISAFVAIKFLTKYFQTKTLIPFAIYCTLMGIVSSIILFLK